MAENSVDISTALYDKAMEGFRAACDEYHFYDCPSSGPVWDKMIQARDLLWHALGVDP